MSNINAHKELYKETFKKGSPYWKEKFKEKCLSKAKEQKNLQLQRLRQIGGPQMTGSINVNLPEIITEQWNSFQGDSGTSKPMSGTSDGFQNFLDQLSSEDYVDIMHFLEEELQKDLVKEEQAILNKYEEMNNFENAALQAAIEGYYSSSSTIVICPICRKNQLLQNKGIIFCSCGLRLNVKNDISLANLQTLLIDSYQAHGGTCSFEPNFVMETNFGITALCLRCSRCQAYQIIL
eukprot:TRINITY_DN14091_c0_g1_i1.p1 TRINITY_DN14091_c0_g1~~TRINITY_DN14091_c0_g1_i1.p1  ORF type:complete len:236 (+),score=23.35 TRINITY_DN14091_c0_g1_i1:108-815(+)